MNTIVIKCGGSILAKLSDEFFTSIKELQQKGFQIVIVHGGGPEIETMLNQLQIKSEFVNGLRRTTAEVLEVVEMVLSGKVNKSLVNNLSKMGINAVGLAGTDVNILSAKAIDYEKLGFVGEVTHVNSNFLEGLLRKNYLPVLSPIGIADDFNKYNINADTAAASVAIALNAKHLLFVTDVSGILKDGEVVPYLNTNEVDELIEDGTIYGGMIPKVKAALQALSTGQLHEITIINGKDSLLALDGSLKGTKIVKELEVV
ncbi:acetylglutamate kinase [Fredinandcohnia quinoae]|uniref:Acetylglutamate kinase n=1 Tax=Fredinandcohnia quinoae TaxID=2918902 RepID=A0AAW5E770_9BACI|nr:acetylglutamate kinase [Fredinandcohnia sp. SECRCQ15]MCH1625872.1 acetylglutamate kinase [Fredinandcohnia sp. SECRCQ15]